MTRKLVVALALISSTTALATPWTRNMQNLFQSLQELLVLTVDDAKFNDPKNKVRIENAAEAMMKGAHDVTKMRGKSPDLDPSVGIFSALLQDESKRAYEAYKSGHQEYARSLFKNMASACVACHSRTAAGSKLQWDFSTGFAQGLSPYQQAELLAAGRSFDAALTSLEKVLTDSEMAKKRPYDWNRALRFALAISIRIERDPAKALALLEKTSKTPGIPQFSKLDMQDWIRSLTAWKTEKAAGATEPSTEEGLNKEAKRLLGLAKAAQRYPMDRAGDILYLRATSLLHQQLQVAPAGEKSGEAMLLLGLSYEVLRDFELWNLNEVYFEACINRAPHTETSETCYRKLEESVIAGYTGSSGTDIPSGAQKKLDSLRKMASAPAIGKKVQ
jgi:cytochrome c553